MYGFKRITVVGDSYCENQSNDTDWSLRLGSLLGVPSIGKGRGGCAWWTARQNLIEKFSHDAKNTLLFVVHTGAERLPNDYEIPMNASVLYPDDHPNSLGTLSRWDPTGEAVVAGKYFYKSRLFSARFYEWAQQAWIKELDDEAYKFFKIIHIPAFAYTKINVKNSIVISPALYTLSAAENPSMVAEDARLAVKDTRRNHFNEHNNIKLAESLAKIVIDTDQNYVGTIGLGNLSEWDLKK
jgi:hypothetical protein